MKARQAPNRAQGANVNMKCTYGTPSIVSFSAYVDVAVKLGHGWHAPWSGESESLCALRVERDRQHRRRKHADSGTIGLRSSQIGGMVIACALSHFSLPTS